MVLARTQLQIVHKLRELGHLDDIQVERIESTDQNLSGEEVERQLMEEFAVSQFNLLLAKSRCFHYNPFNAKRFAKDEYTFEKLDKDYCQEKGVLPLGMIGDFFAVVLDNPFQVQLIQEIERKTRSKVHVLLGLTDDINAALEDEGTAQVAVGFGDVVDQLGMEYGAEEEINEESLSDEESGPIIQLASRLIEDAYYSGGSDIHVEPFENETRVRVRVDGICQTKLNLPRKVSAALLARIKVMANLDIAEKRVPQDGRIVYKQFNKKGIDIDLRVATCPLNHGEGCVMRILDKQKSTLPLTALGFSEENLGEYRELIRRPYGMILHCGPTGSGKSMTLYSALNEINDPTVNIRTAEDPIEYTLPGLCQVQMNRKIGLTFAAALRAFLRQDPDIILVGEIRDQETANIAVEAALTGHMLFSTLHTNDAPSTVARLTEMGIEPFMISASLVCVCAQRLMRRVCKNCRQPYEPEGNERTIIEEAIKWSGSIYRASPNGCPACGGSGYKGRIGIHELMSISDELVKGINEELETARLKDIAVRNGMRTLHQDSMIKVRDGITSMEEALATVPPDMKALQIDSKAPIA
ncbi:GspE/PulE family protein [Puniceicoccus vermicola]|uniref:Type II/IV secretion system protein n=1 Tax=Puniceicoccus vermicola TaxID=388746 RepID=A0A7X1B110_9BACT|nr:GspE/PulE family protein [Puniceicoccus vermicola]MBC2603641.1 type II/IV secretion system protein [Puniceicoccus vermicola]